MIREARIDEVRKVAEYMTQFEQATQFVKVDVDHTVGVYENLISKGIAVFLILEDDGKLKGGLGAIKHPDLHDGKLTAVETFWFVSPEHRGQGLRLFNAFERWAKENGCQKLAMIHLADSYPDTLERLYERKGYRLAEKHYIKEITI